MLEVMVGCKINFIKYITYYMNNSMPAARPISKLTTLANNIHAAWSPDGHYFAVGNSVS